MEPTITGVVLVLLFIMAMWKVRNGALYMVTFFVPFASTAIINVTAFTFSATPYHIFGSVLIGLTLLQWTARPIDGNDLDSRSPFLWMIGFLAMLIASTFELATSHGVTKYVVFQSVILVLGFLFSWAVANNITSTEITRRLITIYLWGGLFAASWGLFQWVCLNTGLPYPAEIFNNSISDSGALFDQTLKQTTYVVYRLSSVSMEPSHIARYLLSVLLIAIVMIGEGIGRVPFGRLYIYLVSGVIALTTSSTGLMGLVLVYSFAMVVYTRVFLRDVIIMGMTGLFLLLLSPKLATIAASVTVDKEDTGSFDLRADSMVFGYKAFTQAPFFGHGWGWFKGGSTLSQIQDLLFKLLSSVGLIGFTLFLIFCVSGIMGAWVALRRVDARLVHGRLSEEERDTGRFLRAATLAFMGCFLLSLFLDAIASFIYYAAFFWFIFGAMVGISRTATAWAREEAVTVPLPAPLRRAPAEAH